MKVFLDLDGVMTDFIGGLARAHNLGNPYDQEEYVGNPNLPEVFGLKPAALFSVTERDFWRDLEPSKEGRKILDILEKKFGRENIRVLSSLTLNEGVADGKIEWMKRNMPYYGFQRKYFFGPDKGFLAHPDSILIDDSEKNTKPFEENGGKAFLVPRKWNSNHALSNKVIESLNSFIASLNKDKEK